MDHFVQKIDDDHHVEAATSPLVKIEGFDVTTDLPFEYMHLVCLGIVKKLLNLWIKGRPSNYKLSSQACKQISDKLRSLSSQTVAEFSRKPRGLKEVDRWKATEFRSFLLYTRTSCIVKHIGRPRIQ